MTTTDSATPTDTDTSAPGTTITVIWPGGSDTYPVGDDPGGDQDGGHNGRGGHH